jgi:hypothetical protein
MRPSAKFLTLLFLQGFAVFVLTGCATRHLEPTHSGFLDSYSGFTQDAVLKGMRVCKKPDTDIGALYSKVMIRPLQFKLSLALKAGQMAEGDRAKLADFFYVQLKDGLTGYYEIVDEPGEGVLLIRAAVTDILPNKVYLNLHWSTTLVGAGIGGAAFEAEIVDSLTGERVMAFIDARKGKKLNYVKGLTKWGHTQEVLGVWADMITANLNKKKEKGGLLVSEK